MVACDSGHWECTKKYNTYFYEKMMFPLSDESDTLALGWLDTYYWSEFETEIIPQLLEGIPRLILIKDAG